MVIRDDDLRLEVLPQGQPCESWKLGKEAKNTGQGVTPEKARFKKVLTSVKIRGVKNIKRN